MATPFKRLVLSGGGISGMAMLGCLSALKRMPGVLDGVTTVAGTSVGSMVGAMLCIGVDMQTAFEMMCAMDRQSLTSVSLGNIPTTYGFDDGAGLDRLIGMFIPPSLTFSTIRQVFGKRLVVYATSLTEQKCVTFDETTAPNMSVALAVRMSCSVPLVYSSVRHDDGNVYVDGGVTNNFAFHDPVSTLGIRIVFRPPAELPVSITNLAEFLDALFRVAIPADDLSQTRKGSRNIISIQTPVPATVLYDVTDAQLRELYRLGYTKAYEFVKKNA